jgi:hypothetical protein
MATYNTGDTARTASGFLGLASLIMGGMGLVFYIFQPFGIVFGAAGVVVGLAGVVLYFGRGGRPLHLALGGLILSAAALATGVMLPTLLDTRVDQDYFHEGGRGGSPYTAPPGKAAPGR